jgi:hypothetical protein
MLRSPYIVFVRRCSRSHFFPTAGREALVIVHRQLRSINWNTERRPVIGTSNVRMRARENKESTLTFMKAFLSLLSSLHSVKAETL